MTDVTDRCYSTSNKWYLHVVYHRDYCGDNNYYRVIVICNKNVQFHNDFSFLRDIDFLSSCFVYFSKGKCYSMNECGWMWCYVLECGNEENFHRRQIAIYLEELDGYFKILGEKFVSNHGYGQIIFHKSFWKFSFRWKFNLREKFHIPSSGVMMLKKIDS